MSSNNPPRQKIAILGGGIGAITTAWYLTHTQDLRDRYEVTLYQMGWRLGGKLASGTNRDLGWRNEEHGLHVWFGCYDNAFATFRACCEEMIRLQPDYRFKGYLDVFKPLSFTPIGNLVAGKYGFWDIHWPANGGVPGVGDLWRQPWETIIHIWEYLRQFSHGLTNLPGLAAEHPAPTDAFHRVFQRAIAFLDPKTPAAAAVPAPQESGIQALLGRTHALFHSLTGREAEAPREHFDLIVWCLNELRRWVLPEVVALARKEPDAHMMLSVVDFGIAFLCGLFNPKYGIMQDLDLGRIDHLDLREWLIENGGNPDIVNRTSWIRAFYDTPFAYRDGDLSKPSFAAGAGTRFALRLGATYKGAPLYLGQAGFGSAVIAPYYRVLASRGVKVKFFHKVKRLALSPDRSEVRQIHLDLQAAPADPTQEYQPTFWDDRAKLHCWPNTPLWDQLRDGAAMRDAAVDLESNWCQWPAAAQVTLEQGIDFDAVVLAISLGAFKSLNAQDPSMCAELMEASPRFKEMVDNQELVATFAPQFWFNPTSAQLGWPQQAASVAAPEPNDVWADMSQVLPTERWNDPGPGPSSLMYSCGALPTRLYAAPSTDPSIPAQARALTDEITADWIRNYGTTVWPGATAPDGTFNYSTLFDPREKSGPQRLDAQFLRTNIDPTECCITSFPGTIQHRLKGDASGFKNLYLAGDWTNTTLNVTCVEATTISGMIAARAITGEALVIVGEHFFDGSDTAE